MSASPDQIEALKQRKAELEKRVADIQKDYRRGLSADSEERAVELENAQTLEEIQRIALEELRKIDEQLIRAQTDT